MGHTDLYDHSYAVLAKVGSRLRIPIDDAELRRLHSNALFALPSAGLLIRIATNPDALERVAASVMVTRWLSEHGYPCVVPANVKDQPFTVLGRVVSIWRLAKTVPEPPATGSDLGRLLRDLHQRRLPPHQLRQLNDPLTSVAQAIEGSPKAISEPDRSWLVNRIAELRERWTDQKFAHPPGLIHGDAHPANLMRVSTGDVIVGDWDQVACGPREWDLAQLHYFRRRFGEPTEHDIEEFTNTYGWDVRLWPGLNTLIAIREISSLSPYLRTASTKTFAQEQLSHRIETLRRDDIHARWESQPQR